MGSSFPIVEATVSDLQTGMREGRLRARELVDAYLERIAAFDRAGPTLNSVITTHPRAREEAERLDADLEREGRLRGPLHGIPVLVKDNIETADLPTSFGNEAFADYQPEADATAVRRLREAGAIILGKTAMPDFATSWWGYSSRSGETRNPYDLAHDPGGSSSGTGAAIAANLAAVGLGTDCGGSVRVPSSFNNLVGIRCTPGLVSRHGLAILLFFQDTIGPMARTVEDAVRVFEVLAGYDAADSLTHAAAARPATNLESLRTATLAGARLGVVTGTWDRSYAEGAAVFEVLQTALESARKAGAATPEFGIPGLWDFVAETSLYETCSKHDINAFLGERRGVPVRTLSQLYESGRYHPKLDLLEACARGPEQPEHDPLYFRRLAAREAFARSVGNAMAQHEVDALVFPTVQVPSPSRAELDAGRWATMEFPVNTLIASQTWMPAVSVPVGFTPEGLPVGLEIVCRPYDETRMFRLAAALEALAEARRPPASAPEIA